MKSIFKFCVTLGCLFSGITVSAQNYASDSAHVENVLPFQAYDPVIANRVETMGKGMGFTYNAVVHDEIQKYGLRKTEMGNMLGLSAFYFPLFEKALAHLNLPDELKYLPIIESSLNPLAISVSGAAGLWQFMPTTGKGYGLQISNFEDQRHDPTLSSVAAAAYLRDMYTEFGDWLLTLAAYNCGAGTVRRAMQKHGINNYWDLRPYLPEQAQKYIPKFIASLYMLKHAEALGVACRESQLDIETEQIVVHGVVSFREIAKTLDVSEDLIQTLNPVYKRKIVQGSNNAVKPLLLPKIPMDKYPAMFDLLNAATSPSNSNRDFSSNLVKGILVYKVVKGDNLTKIANRFKVSTQAIVEINNLKSDSLHIGQVISIPGVSVDGHLASN